MIYDETLGSDVNILNTQFSIVFGSIYYSAHVIDGNINIRNVSIMTNQLNMNNDFGLLHFAAIDTVKITNMSILYKYNTTKSCYYYQTISNPIIDASCSVFHCSNPIIAIYNKGEVRFRTMFDFQNLKDLWIYVFEGGNEYDQC